MEALAPGVLERRPTLKDLLDLPSFTEVCRSYMELYGIGIRVFDADGTRLVDLRIGNGDFCGYVFSKAEGRTRCTATVRAVKDTGFDLASLGANPAPEDAIVTRPCFTGLSYVVMPVLHEGDVLGKVIFGPFRPSELRDLPESLLEIDGDFDAVRAQAEILKIRQAPEATLRRVLTQLRLVLEVILHSGYKALLTSTMHIEAVTDSHRELMHKNRALEESLERLKELDRLKSNFLATVSHELRTPLTSVIGYSEMLIEGLAGSMSAEQQEYVRTIMEKGENLLQIITSILDISKIESGRVALTPIELDLTEVARTAVSTVHPQAQKKGLRMELRVASEIPRISADRDKIRQCLVNLLANAVKFTSRGGQVLLAVERYTGVRRHFPDDADQAFALFEPRENHWVRLSVQDSGIGIPPDKLDRVFDTFYQVDNSSTREYGGTGLGLSIVKSYVEAHGGEVWLDSEMGKGSTFSILLPLESGATMRGPNE